MLAAQGTNPCPDTRLHNLPSLRQSPVRPSCPFSLQLQGFYPCQAAEGEGDAAVHGLALRPPPAPTHRAAAGTGVCCRWIAQLWGSGEQLAASALVSKDSEQGSPLLQGPRSSRLSHHAACHQHPSRSSVGTVLQREDGEARACPQCCILSVIPGCHLPCAAASPLLGLPEVGGEMDMTILGGCMQDV